VRYDKRFTTRSAVRVLTMGMQCHVCGKKPSMGNQISRRGKAKYLGGVGRKVTGISRRKFKPNLQRMQCQVGGSVKTLRVFTQCFGRASSERHVKKKTFTMPTTL